MTLDHTVLIASVGFALVACGREDARSPEATHQPTAVVAPAAQDRVPKRPSNADVRAELEAAQAKDAVHVATVSTEDASTGTEAAEDGGAPVAHDAERRDFETKLRDRIAKIDARARELQQKGTKLTATKKTSFETSFRRFHADRADAGTKLDLLGRSGAGWKTGRTGVERSLDDLESTLSKLDDQM